MASKIYWFIFVAIFLVLLSGVGLLLYKTFRWIDETYEEYPGMSKYLKCQAVCQVTEVVSSMVALVIIGFRKCEFFTIWTPLFIFVTSLALFLLSTFFYFEISSTITVELESLIIIVYSEQ